MTETPDFRGHAAPDQSNDLLHRIAAKIPGYTGYHDLENRREADKMLRNWLARQYRDQLQRLTRLEGQLGRGHHSTALVELQRLDGQLNRFVDKLETATYGYAGLFDTAKIGAPELDQLYHFDQGLLTGVQQIHGVLDTLEGSAQGGAEMPELTKDMGQLGQVLDDLLQLWGHRSDVLTSGQALPPAEYDRFRAAQGAPTGRLDPYTAPPNAGIPGGNMGGGSYTVQSGNAGDPATTERQMGSGAPDTTPRTGDEAVAGTGRPATNAPADRVSHPGGAAVGGAMAPDLAGPPPLVGGGESMGSTAPNAGATDQTTRRFTPADAPATSPDAADGEHSTHG